jgi:hypothetical protein
MNDRLKSLLILLIKRTDSRSVAWERITDRSFAAKIGAGTVRIHCVFGEIPSPDPDGENGDIYTVVVTDAEGRIAEEQEFTKYDTGFELASELLKSARRVATDSESVIGSMMAALGG